MECTHKTEQRLTGTIVDENSQPVPYTNVYLLHPSDSTVIGGGVSNEAGIFVIPYDQPGDATIASKGKDEDALPSKKEVMDRLGVSSTTLWNWKNDRYLLARQVWEENLLPAQRHQQTPRGRRTAKSKGVWTTVR